MQAKDCREGIEYLIRKQGTRAEFDVAECIGWNYSNEFLLFLTFNEYGQRKIRSMGPEEEIQLKSKRI